MANEGGLSPACRPGGPILLVLSGPSGVGKDAVLQELRKLDRPWHFVVTATTRPMRPGERDGVDYIFMTPEEFQRELAAGGFLEHANVYGRWYGVPRRQVREALERGHDVILKIDVQGAATVKRLAPGAVFVFLAPPTLEELERRLRGRNSESEEQLRVRLATAREEMKALPMFDYLVINESGRIGETVRTVEAIVVAEHCRIPPRRVAL